ncbi:MAG: polysaccharide deacetylase family protein [Alphaproteobacteria bacterium]|nr:polysaccharide deacetylase family protein [Alphaproteobacteria bacterium]
MTRLLRRLLALLLVPLLAAAGHTAPAKKRIALTFDDVPRMPGAFFTPEERTRRLLAALKQNGVRQAAFFITPGNLEQPYGKGGESRIAAYVRAGHVIANHSYSHRHLSELTVQDYVTDLDRAAAWLNGRPGVRRWYRYPFLDEAGADVAKRDALRAALKARGLHNGYVTSDSNDWLMEALAVDAKRAGQPMDLNALRDLYVRTVVGAADFSDALARKTLGRSPAQVILMHETDLEAMFVADAVKALKADGWEIVTADAAFADPIALEEPNSIRTSMGQIAAMADARGVPLQRLFDRTFGERAISAAFAAQVLHQPASGR